MGDLIDVGPWLPSLRRKARKLVVLEELRRLQEKLEDEEDRERLSEVEELVKEL